MNKEIVKIKRVLISVFDKDGVVELAKKLESLGVEILSTGGTAELLQKNNIKVKMVSDFTGFPEIMDGRVKSLHPKIHGGILAIRDNKKHVEEAKTNKIEFIDLVITNLYPFSEVIKKKNIELDEVIKNIDIGGPSMIRSAAKNFSFVGVASDPQDYDLIISEIEEKRGLTYETRKKLSKKAFQQTALYDSVIYNYLSEQGEDFPEITSQQFEKLYDLRYGENPHQKASFYKDVIVEQSCIPSAKVLQGKELSYNNINDADAALFAVREFKDPASVVVKHANPCGVSTDENITQAFKKAYAADSMSAFGGIIALNRECNKEIASDINKVFAEIVLAPSFSKEALNILAKKKNLRLLELGSMESIKGGFDWKKVEGGMLRQDKDVKNLNKEDLKIVTDKKPSNKEIEDMLFAWQVIKHVKSNAILIAKNKVTIGTGAGQMSRFDSVEIAIKKAGKNINGSILASDAFFPFRDGIDKLKETGISAIIQPGGSIKDKEVIEAANEHGLVMVFTNTRAFKH